MRKTLIGRYTELDAGSEARQTFAQLTSDAELQKSWVRAAGASATNQAGIRKAITQFNKIDDLGHNIDEFRRADEVNDVEYGPDYADPHAEGTIAMEFVTSSNDEFARVHGSDNQVRSWMMRQDEIEGLTPAEIQSKYSLPEDPVYVSDVNVPQGTRVRVGVVEENFGGRRGATQFELDERISSGNFHNQRALPIE